MNKGQYNYLLLKKMQNYISCTNSMYRTYLYNFYGEIFNDPSVIINEENYNEFCDLMDYEIQYLHSKGITDISDAYEDEGFENFYGLLKNSFEAIGIQISLIYITDPASFYVGYPEKLKFVMPSGEIKYLEEADSYYSSIVFNTQFRCTDSYLYQMMPFYLLETEEPKDLFQIGTKAAGQDTRWSYDEDEKTLTIEGTGSLTSFELWPLLGLKDIEVMILGAGVSKLNSYSLQSSITIVDLHGENDEIELSESFCNPKNWIGSGHTERVSLIVYTDNLILKNANWGDEDYTTVEFHPLSEWTGA